MHRKSKSNLPGGKDQDGELNNVKVTDFQSKEMMLLTSQIFDIKPEMNESRTSNFNNHGRTATETSATDWGPKV